MFEVKDPGPRGKNRPTILQDAIRFAKENRGQWILAREYGSPSSATAVAAEYRKRHPEAEFTTRYKELYIRIPGVETK